MPEKNAMNEISYPEFLRLLGEKEAEIYRLRRNEQILIAKLDGMEKRAKDEKAK